MERKAISKKIRFEVFKRDKFTCQYCGRKAPDVVLNVDHINPVAEGGTNDILNLITACFACNNGKRAIPLSQSEVLDKQRKQMEELQERREQIEMMFEWKQSLDDLSDYSSSLLIEYIESLISPNTINENGRKTVRKYLNTFALDEILEAVDISARQYIKYDADNNVISSSAEQFFGKIGGIASNRRKTPIEQKKGYIAAICRNRFNYWNARRGMAILTNYISALRNYGWSDEKILQDLDAEAMDLAKSAMNWSEWSRTMEGWIEDIRSWEKNKDSNSEETNTVELSVDDIANLSKRMVREIEDVLMLMKYVTIPFHVDYQKTIPYLIANIRTYIHKQIETLCKEPEEIEKWMPSYSLLRKLRFFDCVETNDENLSPLTFRVNDMYTQYIRITVAQEFFLGEKDLRGEKDLMIFKHFFEGDIKAFCKEKSIEILWDK